MFNYDVERGGVTAWKRGKDGTITTVNRVMNMNLIKKGSIQFTRYATEAKGGLFNQMPMKKGKGQVPLKGCDIRLANKENYGGYNKATGAYAFLVESDGKKGRQRTIEFVRLYQKEQFERNGEESMERYCSEELGLINPKIILKKIKLNSLFVVNGFPMHLTCRSNNTLQFKGASQLVLDNISMEYIKRIIKYVDRMKNMNVNLKVSHSFI